MEQSNEFKDSFQKENLTICIFVIHYRNPIEYGRFGLRNWSRVDQVICSDGNGFEWTIDKNRYFRKTKTYKIQMRHRAPDALNPNMRLLHSVVCRLIRYTATEPYNVRRFNNDIIMGHVGDQIYIYPDAGVGYIARKTSAEQDRLIAIEITEPQNKDEKITFYSRKS